MKPLLISFFLLLNNISYSQSYNVTGKIINAKQDAIAFVTIQVKEVRLNTISKEDGTFLLELDKGKYDLIVTMVGYKTQIITVIIEKKISFKTLF